MHAQNSTTPPSEKDLAQTRWADIRHLEVLLGASCVLDVCATEESAKAAVWFGPMGIYEDAFSVNGWNDIMKLCLFRPLNAFAYCNPPFSNIGDWFRKCVEESEYCMIVGCCPHTASSGWWENYVEKATFIIVPGGKQARRTFLRPNGKEFTNIDSKTGKEVLSSPTGAVCFPVWCMPRVKQPVYIRSQFPVIDRGI